MIKNNNGVTLMSLIITIVVIVILLSIVGYFSIDSVKNSHIANEKKEMANVEQYVSIQKAKLLMDEFDENTKFGGISDNIISADVLDFLEGGISKNELDKINNNIISEDDLNLLASGIRKNELRKMKDVNDYLNLDGKVIPDKCKYLYITEEELNKEAMSTEYVILKDIKNNYIINFFTGTIIGLYDNSERVEIKGIIKGKNEIYDEL